jgi:DNA invertase Pin-like site-specific DNA recombinase
MSKSKASREPEVFAYVRVSSKDQSIDRQLMALEPFAIPPANLFIERKSGKDFNRPRYKQMLRRLRKGDLVYFCELDRLGRDYNEIIEQWRFITREKGADIKILEMPLLDTTYYKDLLGTFIADLVLSVLSFTAHKEREKTLRRLAEGIAAAKAKGVVFGRKAVEVPDNFGEIYRQWRNKELSGEQTAELCGFSLKTLYNLTADWRAPGRREE